MRVVTSWRNPTVRKPTTLHDEPRNMRERVGLWLARRIVAEYQDELASWIMRADAGWAEVAELRAGRGNPRVSAPDEEIV